jgi:hypothetical protein
MNPEDPAGHSARSARALTTSLFALALGGCSLFGIRTAEEADYVVVETRNEFELRDYAALVTVETTVDAAFEDAGKRAFGKLFAYISGENRAREEIEMTTPVVASADGGESIAMTAPVTAARERQGWRYSFVLPARYTIETAPLPLRDDVGLAGIEPRRVAVLTFSGTWRESTFDENLGRLRDWIERNRLEIASAPRYASYDPPWAIPFLRRNEIMIDVKS